MGSSRACWSNEQCTSESGRPLRTRACCEHTDPEFAMMHSDLHNLVPAVGQVNAIRSNHPYGEVEGEERRFGACDFEDDGDHAEPAPGVRGDVARVYLYMEGVYGMTLTTEERGQFEAWHEVDPPDGWEREWNRRVEAVQGNRNPFIE